MDSNTILHIDQIEPASSAQRGSSLGRLLRAVLHSHCVEIVGHRVYVSQGCTLYEGLSAVTFVFDRNTNRWTSVNLVGDVPQARRTASFTLVGDSMYLVGGRVLPRTGLAEVWRLDLVLNTWEKCEVFGERVPETSGHKAAYFASRRQLLLLSVGTDLMALGTRGVKALNMETMTLESPRIKGQHPVLLPYSSACATNNAVFMFGGKLFGDHPHSSNVLHVLKVDEVGLAWSKPRPTGQVPERRRSSQMNYFHGRLILFGGRDDVRYMEEIYMYDIQQEEWTKIEHEGFQQPLAGHQSLVIDDRIFMFAGEHGPIGARKPSRNIWILSMPERRTKKESWWKTLKS